MGLTASFRHYPQPPQNMPVCASQKQGHYLSQSQIEISKSANETLIQHYDPTQRLYSNFAKCPNHACLSLFCGPGSNSESHVSFSFHVILVS